MAANLVSPRRLSLKLELLQHSGSFKGARRVLQIWFDTRGWPKAGVVAASGG